MRTLSILVILALAGCSSTSYSVFDPTQSLTVPFDAKQAGLSATGMHVIESAVSQYHGNNETVMITVVGYADSKGDEYRNLSLSATRAETVKRALVNRGIPTGQVQMRAFGVTDPIEGIQPTDPQNRRVVITW